MVKATAVLAAAALALAACGSGDNGGAASNGTTAKQSGGGAYGKPSSKSSGSESKGANEIEAYDNYFDPKTITGKPGAKVTIELKNEGSAEHSLTIDSQGVDKDVEGGEDAKVTVTIPKSGSIEFYCKYHKALGMTGTLEAT